MLAIGVDFLTGRYVATAYNDRRHAEWPPHPARLFSALAATHFDDPYPDERHALEWLEQQPPPCLSASGASERDVYTAFVPVNDKASDPDQRARQPRTFPAVTPDDPRVAFVWPDAVPPPIVVEALGRLTARVVRLGHSSSLVNVRILKQPVRTNWRPDSSGGYRLRVVRPAQLQSLETLFDLHKETEPRVMPAAFQLYTDRPLELASDVPHSVFTDDWLVLRRSGGVSLPSSGVVGLAKAVRGAILKHGSDAAPETVTGHGADGRPSEQPHLAIVPLPFLGSAHADGALLGVALILPRDLTQLDRRVLYRAVAGWEESNRTGDADPPALPVLLGRAGVLTLTRLESQAEQRTLRPESWCGPARRWLSATPVALDRNPGDLQSRDPKKLAEATSEAEGIIRLACERIGLPAPVGVRILPAAPLTGATKARHFGAFPGTDSRTQRVLTHASVTFETPVGGPLLLGAGRYLGLGLFRPADHD